MPKLIDLTGQRFGKLTVIQRGEDVHFSGKPCVCWVCRCDCGKIKTISGASLRSGHTKSCGCSMVKHGKSHKERLYETWKNMRRRCYDKSNKRYANYGGKGVSICDDWNEYSNFRKWALENGYSENLTIDRIDVNGNYCPENCRWTDNIVQANNTTRNRYIEYNGKIQSMADWAREFGIKYYTMNNRIQHGWSMDKIKNTPERGV